MTLSIIDRTVGAHSISIGTSLAIEAITHTGDFSTLEGKPAILECDALYLNIRTLARNAYGSFDTKKSELSEEVLRETIISDIEQIKEVAKATSPNILCVPYLCSLKSLNTEFKTANFKNANTPLQVFYNTLEMSIYRTAKETWPDLLEFDIELKGDGDTLILTNQPIDLLSHKKFPSLKLLESHTGKVKGRTEWYTKLNGKSKLIPFNRAMLVMFGDGVMFAPQAIKVRRVVLKIAEAKRWTQTTTKDKIFHNLRTANEPYVLDFVRKIWKH
jgi:hypothetical protein